MKLELNKWWHWFLLGLLTYHIVGKYVLRLPGAA